MKQTNSAIRAGVSEQLLACTPVCRVCLESGPASVFLTPCRCRGSLQYIHEECLKSWIEVKTPELSTAACELCKAPYFMTYTVTSKFSIRSSLNRSRSLQTFFVVLLAVMVMFGVILYVVTKDFLKERENQVVTTMLGVLLGAFGLAASFIGVLLGKTCHNLFWDTHLANWSIVNLSSAHAQEDHCLQDTESPDSDGNAILGISGDNRL